MGVLGCKVLEKALLKAPKRRVKIIIFNDPLLSPTSLPLLLLYIMFFLRLLPPSLPPVLLSLHLILPSIPRIFSSFISSTFNNLLPSFHYSFFHPMPCSFLFSFPFSLFLSFCPNLSDFPAVCLEKIKVPNLFPLPIHIFKHFRCPISPYVRTSMVCKVPTHSDI